MEQDLIKLMADSMSVFSLYLKDPENFDFDWLQKHYGLSDDGLNNLKGVMIILYIKLHPAE